MNVILKIIIENNDNVVLCGYNIDRSVTYDQITKGRRGVIGTVISFWYCLWWRTLFVKIERDKLKIHVSVARRNTRHNTERLC